MVTPKKFATIRALDKDNVNIEEFVMESDVCIIGRSEDGCNIIVSNKIVSRVHAKVERDASQRYKLTDDGSANGTFVNGFKIREPYILRHMDEIGLGSDKAILCFVDPDATLRVNSRLHYDKGKILFFIDKKHLELTTGQFRLLQHLYNNAYEICTRESCAEAIWGREYDPGLDAQALDRAISNLRRSIRDVAGTTEFLKTRRGMGYILILDP